MSSNKPQGISPERLAALSGSVTASLSATTKADLKGFVPNQQYSDSCLCCGLAISEKMLNRSASRSRTSTKKPVYTIPSGIFAGKYLCKVCANSGGSVAALSLESHDGEKVLEAFREVVCKNLALLLTKNSSDVAIFKELNQKLNFGEWPGHMRAPNEANRFWVLLSAIKQQEKESKK